MQYNKIFIIVFVIAAFLRVWNLGYSDYQGDEIKALYRPKEMSSLKFFLEQRKGPLQFLITASLKSFSNDYKNRFLVRFPFALAGTFSVFIFYLVVKEVFNQKIALYSSLFFATNGFLVAFSRIVQYQSFVIFFGLLAIYFCILYYKKLSSDKNFNYLILSAIALAFSVLSHYDGVFFAPLIFFCVLGLLKKDYKNRLLIFRQVILAFLAFIFLTGIFYVPFAFNLSKSTKDYWAGRISGKVSTKISSSRYLFSVYQPIYVLHIYEVLGVLGFCSACLFVFSSALKRLSKLNLMFKKIGFDFYLYFLLGLITWFLLPFAFMEGFVSIPGTHIYTYLIPLFVFMGLFLSFFQSVFRIKNLQILVSLAFYLGVGVLGIFLFAQSYFIFVDNKQEYPWENEKFFIWTLHKPTPIFHLSMFGFPYFRYWDEIGEFIRNDARSVYYSTNERESISRYHIPLIKDGNKAGYYVYIKNPQTFTNEITNKRILEYTKHNEPIKTYARNGEVVAKIYFIAGSY